MNPHPHPPQNRYRDQGGRDRTDLTQPASWELYVDMRFDQLRTACDLELWAEAFRSVEDIQVPPAWYCCVHGALQCPRAVLWRLWGSSMSVGCCCFVPAAGVRGWPAAPPAHTVCGRLRPDSRVAQGRQGPRTPPSPHPPPHPTHLLCRG